MRTGEDSLFVQVTNANLSFCIFKFIFSWSCQDATLTSAAQNEMKTA